MKSKPIRIPNHSLPGQLFAFFLAIVIGGCFASMGPCSTSAWGAVGSYLKSRVQLWENDWIDYTNSTADFKVRPLNHRRDEKTGEFKPKTSEVKNGDLTFSSWGFPLGSNARGQVFRFAHAGKSEFAASELHKTNDHVFFRELLRYRIDNFIKTVPGGQLDSFEEDSTDFPYSADFTFSQPRINIKAKGRIECRLPNQVWMVFGTWIDNDNGEQTERENEDKSNAMKFLGSFEFLDKEKIALEKQDLVSDWKEHELEKLGLKVFAPKDIEGPKNYASELCNETNCKFPITGVNGKFVALLEVQTTVFEKSVLDRLNEKGSFGLKEFAELFSEQLDNELKHFNKLDESSADFITSSKTGEEPVVSGCRLIQKENRFYLVRYISTPDSVVGRYAGRKFIDSLEITK